MVRIKKVRLERLNMCTAIRTSRAILDFCHFFQEAFNLNDQNHKEGIFYMYCNTRFLSSFPEEFDLNAQHHNWFSVFMKNDDTL